MLYEQLLAQYNRARLAQYRRLFGQIRERSGSLSATEAFALDVIYLLGRPTMKQFSDFLGISQPNATYKINALAAKGYVKKETDPDDGREHRLVVQEKFYRYYGDSSSFLQKADAALSAALSPEEMAALEKALAVVDSLAFAKKEENENGSF